jgi:predicted TIM-barrel fold metal-dependent hydrolase
MLRRLIDAYGPERLMWASDCPFQVAPPHDYASAVSLIRDGLDEYSAGDRNAIMRGTAERLFFNP